MLYKSVYLDDKIIIDLEKQEKDFNRGFKYSSITISFQDLEGDVFDEE